MQYIKEGATLPVPFNIIPTPKTIIYLVNKVVNLCKKNESKHSVNLNGMASNGRKNGNGSIHQLNDLKRRVNSYSQIKGVLF